MLLFKREHRRPILADEKVETRRLWEKVRVKLGSLQQAKVTMISKDYFALLKIMSLGREPLLDIDDAGARREGYPDRETYLKKWDEIVLASGNSKPEHLASANPLVWVVGYDRVKEYVCPHAKTSYLCAQHGVGCQSYAQGIVDDLNKGVLQESKFAKVVRRECLICGVELPIPAKAFLCKCGKQAEKWFGLQDPDCSQVPKCRTCLDQLSMEFFKR